MRLGSCNDNCDIIFETLQYFPVHGVPVEIYTGEIRDKQGFFLGRRVFLISFHH